jgi:hypothetical protein
MSPCQKRGKEFEQNKTTEQNVVLCKPRSCVLLRLNIKTLLMYNSYLTKIVVSRIAIKRLKKVLSDQEKEIEQR